MDFVDLDSSPTLDQKKADNKYMKFQCCCFFVEKGEGGGVVKYLIYPVDPFQRMADIAWFLLEQIR